MDHSTLLVLAPFFLGAALLLGFSSLRAWKVHDKNVDRVLVILFILITAVLAGLTQLGTDAPIYRTFFNGLTQNQNPYSWWEPGFYFLALLFAKAGASYGVFVFANVLISHLLELHAFSKLTCNVALAFFCLFCFNLGEITFIRQYLAAALLLVSFLSLQERRTSFGLFIILCATLIHKSALPVGGLIFLICYGRSAIKPSILLLLFLVSAFLLLPESIWDALVARVTLQLAVYTARGYIQGLQTTDISFFRNVAKFFLYGALAVWMLRVPAQTATQRAQRTAAYFVITLSTLSILLIVLVSPVFARLSIFAFPFLAVSMRSERFQPEYRNVPVQITTTILLLTNLFVTAYPVLKYL
jgi:hypothetical protein